MNEDIIQSTSEGGARKRKSVWVRWIILAVSVVSLIIAGLCIWKLVGFETPYTKMVLTGVYVNSAIYMPDIKLEDDSTKENVGEFIGYISFDNEKKSKIRAFRYLPTAEETARIIVLHRGSYDVYVFDGYVPDGTDHWPKNLLCNAAYVEIRGFDTQGDTTQEFLITDKNALDEIVTALSQLGTQHSQIEISQRYYNMFKDRFYNGAIWLDDKGILRKKDSLVEARLFNMIHENEKEITVHMKDHTKLSYSYYPSAGLIQCYYGYFLSEEQVNQINQLIGLQ